jgi:hypothetical protein
VSDRALTATPTPKLLYVVAVVFFFVALICLMQLITVTRQSFGYNGPASIAMTVAITVCLACVGVYFLTRQYRVASWLMYAMTVYLAFMMFSEPPRATPFYSATRIEVNRILFMLPIVASCIYLARRSLSNT